MKAAKFQTNLINWYDKHGRKDLPWQVSNSYCVWISEIMLQQTQVTSVIDYFNKFIDNFPTLNSLASAKIDDVLNLWSGLGYYNRARNIHKTAIICFKKYNGTLPEKIDELMALPGIGRTTAGAILSLSHDLSFPILDGNVKRVISRVFTIGAKKPSVLVKKLWLKVEYLMPEKNARKYNQALMDLGSLVCKRNKPDCQKCPLIHDCKAFKTNQIGFYPQKTKKTKQIEKTLYVLLARNNNQVLLQKRDSNSIWPNLWFLPIFSSNDELSNTISSQHAKIMRTFSVQHILTHRKLIIKVTVVSSSLTKPTKGQWQDVENIKNLPRPTALKKVLQQG